MQLLRLALWRVDACWLGHYERRAVVRVSDFKCVVFNYSDTSDVTMKTTSPTYVFKVVGELKVPWVDQHDIEAALT